MRAFGHEFGFVVGVGENIGQREPPGMLQFAITPLARRELNLLARTPAYGRDHKLRALSAHADFDTVHDVISLTPTIALSYTVTSHVSVPCLSVLTLSGNSHIAKLIRRGGLKL